MATLNETIQAIVNGSTGAVFTAPELDALAYQLQGSYDNKPVEILSKDLYSVKPFAAGASLSFFDTNGNDLTVSNVQGGQLPAGESHTVHELLIRFIPVVGAVPASIVELLEAFFAALGQSYITVGIANKTPWVQIQGARLFAGLTGFQNVVEAAANTNSVIAGNATCVDLVYPLSIPKIVGEKVSLSGNILFHTPILSGNILVTSGSSMSMHLGGINVRAR
jgi:hypothetical protein